MLHRPRCQPPRSLERLSIGDLEANPTTAVLEIPTPSTAYPNNAISFVTEQYTARAQERYDDVRAAAGELLANAVIHGNERDHRKHIWAYCLWAEGFYLAVRDEGIGFDITNPPFVPGRSGMPPEGGLGLIAVQRRADLVYTDGSAVVGVFQS